MATQPKSPQRGDVFDKALPHNLEAERCILGAVLLDNAALDRARAGGIAGFDEFFLPQHRYIWRAMADCQKAGHPIDTVSLMETLANRQELESAGGVAYLSQLADGLPRITNVEHYAHIVAEKAALRRIVREAFDVQRRALEGGWDLPTLQKQLISAGSAAVADPHENQNGDRWQYSALEFLAAEFPEPEQLITGLIPRQGKVMFVAMPHHLKSWLTLAIAMGGTRAGTLLGKLEVPKPMRTLLFAAEDNRSDVRKRARDLVYSKTFADWDPAALAIWTRPKRGFNIMDEGDFQRLLQGVEKHRADLTIVDVMRTIFRGDINSPKESAALCEQFDRLIYSTGTALAIVHHENRKGEDILRAAAGSFNFTGWADVLIQLKRKSEDGTASRVEIEADYQLGRGIEPLCMTLDFGQEVALRLDSVEDSAGTEELRQRLGAEWTVRDLMEAADVAKANAYRRIKKWQQAGIVERVKGGKRGRTGGLARYTFTQDSSGEDS